MSSNRNGTSKKNRSLQLIGLLLWRSGLMLAAGAGLYNAIEFILRFIDLPLQLEIGLGLIMAGAVFVAGSFVMERIVDYRAEGDLRK